MNGFQVDATSVFAVWGLCEVTKRVGLPARFIPLLAVLLGIASAFLVQSGDVMNGILIGLSAVGLNSGVRNTVQ